MLRLDNNNLERINSTVLDAMRNASSLTDLTLDGNPWICNCEARNFTAFIRSSNMSSLSNVSCSGSGKPLAGVTADQLCPNKPSSTFIGLCLAVAACVVLVGAAAMIYYKFKWEMRVLRFKHQRTVTKALENDKNELINSDIDPSELNADPQAV